VFAGRGGDSGPDARVDRRRTIAEIPEAPDVESLLENYGAVLVAIPVGTMLVLTALLATKLLAPRRATELKGQVYECGMLPIGRNWAQIHVRYYLYAILFLVFDVEIVFLFPWAVSFMGLIEGEAFDKVILWQMVLFVVTLLFGLAYAWRKGVLEWKSKTEAG
jgi:NADH:ubiquinone oxidoreductase subunit 3 (subunit A)